MKKQILIVTAAALTAAVVILNGTRRLLPNRPHSMKLRVSPSPRSRCWRCSPPPKSKSGSALVGNAQWTLRGVPWLATPISPGQVMQFPQLCYQVTQPTS